MLLRHSMFLGRPLGSSGPGEMAPPTRSGVARQGHVTFLSSRLACWHSGDVCARRTFNGGVYTDFPVNALPMPVNTPERRNGKFVIYFRKGK